MKYEFVASSSILVFMSLRRNRRSPLCTISRRFLDLSRIRVTTLLAKYEVDKSIRMNFAISQYAGNLSETVAKILGKCAVYKHDSIQKHFSINGTVHVDICELKWVQDPT